MTFDVPIALIIFNRPDVTAKVFESIRSMRPNRLFVIGDGPRPGRPTESEDVAATRQIIQRVDWPCDVRVCFADENMGCKTRVASGLQWVFDQVERAIVLEDDCLPNASFFSYCRELLDRYADDTRIGAISGNNFQDGMKRSPASYYFSKYFHCWGWASWRRVWQQFDVEIASWPQFRDQGGIDTIADTECESWFWTQVFNDQYHGRVNSWAFPFLYSCWAQHQLTVLPEVNLVSNIGFNDRATHCRQDSDRWGNLPTQAIGPLRHPSRVFRNVAADRYTFGRNFYRDSMSRRIRRYSRNWWADRISRKAA